MRCSARIESGPLRKQERETNYIAPSGLAFWFVRTRAKTVAPLRSKRIIPIMGNRWT